MGQINMENMIFHGSEFIVDKPEYGKGSRFNDYGPGFYCTEHIELAKEWACTSEHGGYANKYYLDLDGLDVLRLNDKEHNILNWLAVLLENRQFDITTDIALRAREYLMENFLPDYRSADVIIGYRADDSYFSFARDFIGNGLSLKQLAKAMYLGELGEQIVIKSPRAFGRLQFIGYEIADDREYRQRRKMRDDDARTAYRTVRRSHEDPADRIYVMDIIRQGWRNEDVRIQ